MAKTSDGKLKHLIFLDAALVALDSPQFAGFLHDLPPEADVNRLRRYLNMPMERILRYKMLLQELLGSTPPEHVDLVPLQSAIQSVDRVANKIEEISEMREKSRDCERIGRLARENWQ
ncbi:unnamed protein product [Peronospora destructor]|uniref:DH domain-containing protein n=1 Tax=Peronospora destructor TaxID=86335 RepID=A0AAV0VCG6_9STRA|nr:unnamed protein product [Peronospora destructor]